jgi:hypothetical protein
MDDAEFERLLAEQDENMPRHRDKDAPWVPAYDGEEPPF